MDEKPVSIEGRILMIAIPAYDGKLNIKSSFALATLAMDIARHGAKLYLTQISGCSLITKARNALVADFLASDATDLLFIDSDIIFKSDDILRLLALSGNKDITAGAYPRRAKDKKFFTDIYLDEQNQIEFRDGMLRVDRIGTGFMLIRRHVLETMKANHPEWGYYNNVNDRTDYALFDFELKNGEYYGEDYTFCNRAKADGFSIYLDPEINLPHIGTEEYSNHFGEEVIKPLIAVNQIAQEAVNG